MTPPLVKTEGLGKRFGQDWVLQNLNLSLERGELLVLLGPNGAGKTTLLKLFSGLLRPTAGTITHSGTPGFVANPPAFHRHFSGLENLAYALRLAGRPVDLAQVSDALSQMGLPPAKAVMNYSSGMKKRLALARLSLLRPDLWLLDEPEAALDTEGRKLLEDMLSEVRKTAGVVVATHERSWVRQASRVLTLGGGAD